jgi:hypothetical protein
LSWSGGNASSCSIRRRVESSIGGAVASWREIQASSSSERRWRAGERWR